MTKIMIEEDLWEEDVEGVITAWLFDDGDTISEGDVVADIMVEKVQHEIVSKVSGTLNIIVGEEETVAKGGTIAEVN